ncbi:MAG: ABC-type transport auxiliary lipoprotein family protein [Steroidobacteraceae bacterium]
MSVYSALLPRRLPALLVLLLAVGCSGLHSDQAATQIYVLAPALPTPAVGASAAGGAAPGATLKVLRPLSVPGLDTDRIALTRSGQRLDYFAHSSWAAPLPELVQSGAIDALRASGRFRAVQSDAAPLEADFLLQLEVRRFHAQYQEDGPPTVRVQLVATLARRSDRTVLASIVATSDVPASANRLQSVSAAFEAAFSEVLAQLGAQLQPPPR